MKEAIDWVIETFHAIDFSPLAHILDLNDLRNIAAILGVFITIRGAYQKWGTKAVYKAKIRKSLNRPSHISWISIANLKEKPLVIYQIVAAFKDTKSFVSLVEFDPPVTIKGLEASSFDLPEYSSLETSSDPFATLLPKFELHIVTESSVVKCRHAKNEQSLLLKKFKGHEQIGKFTQRHNGKIYTEDALYAIDHTYKEKAGTSFILKGGMICDEWPFRENRLTQAQMKDEATVVNTIDLVMKQYGAYARVVKLR